MGQGVESAHLRIKLYLFLFTHLFDIKYNIVYTPEKKEGEKECIHVASAGKPANDKVTARNAKNTMVQNTVKNTVSMLEVREEEK